MNLNDNYRQIKERIDLASKKAGSNLPVKIVAVSKTHSPSVVEELVTLGLEAIGENRIQEAATKFPKVSSSLLEKVDKRMIGHLQSNKINKALQLFNKIDSVDSLSLAKKLDQKGTIQNRLITIMLEVNTSEEETKHGFSPENTDHLLEVLTLKHLNVEGLMTVGPLTRDKKQIRDSFGLLRQLLSTINNQKPTGHHNLDQLSMGMSNDFEIAIEEGSTMVRLGTALLGPRGNYWKK